MRIGHKSARKGKRVVVKMMDGTFLKGKYVETTPKFVVLSDRKINIGLVNRLIIDRT